MTAAVMHSCHAAGTSPVYPHAGGAAHASHRRRSPVGAVNMTGAVTMNRTALALHRLGVLRVRRRPARPTRAADNAAKIEPVISRNFAPALSALMRRDDVVEARAGRIGEQIGFLQFAPA